MKLNEKHTILGPARQPIKHPQSGKVIGVEGEHACHGAGCNRTAGYTVKIDTPLGSRTDKLCRNCVDPSAFGAKKKGTVDVVHRNKSSETSRGGAPIKQAGKEEPMYDVSRGNKAVKYRELSRLSARGHNYKSSFASEKPAGRTTTNFHNPTQGNRGAPGISGVPLKKTILKQSLDVAGGLNTIVEFLKTENVTSSNKELNPMFKDDVNIDEEAVEKTANELIKESLFTTGRDNHLKGDHEFSGFDAKSMLSGEWFGSAAFPTQEPKESGMFGHVDKIIDGQAEEGEGERTSKSPEMIVGAKHEAVTAVVNDLVDDMMEGTPAYLYNPDSVGYLLNELHQSGYESFASVIEGILDDPKKSDVVTLDGIAEELKATKESDFLVEGVKALSIMLFETAGTAMDANVEPPQTQATTVNQSEDATDEETEEGTKL